MSKAETSRLVLCEVLVEEGERLVLRNSLPGEAASKEDTSPFRSSAGSVRPPSVRQKYFVPGVLLDA